MMAGLVIDGGAKAAAQRDAQGAANQAARAGVDAGAAASVQGRDAQAAARAAALASLSDQGLKGSVTMSGTDLLQVTVDHQASTTFLSLFGIDHLQADAQASSSLRVG